MIMIRGKAEQPDSGQGPYLNALGSEQTAFQFTLFLNLFYLSLEKISCFFKTSSSTYMNTSFHYLRRTDHTYERRDTFITDREVELIHPVLQDFGSRWCSSYTKNFSAWFPLLINFYFLL